MLLTSFQHLFFLLCFVNIEAIKAEQNLNFIEKQPIESQKDTPIKLFCITKCQDKLAFINSNVVTKTEDFNYPILLIQKTDSTLTQLSIGELTTPGNTSTFVETEFLSIDFYGMIKLEKLFNQSQQPIEMVIKACDESLIRCLYIPTNFAIMDFNNPNPQFLSPCPKFATIDKDVELNTVLSQIEVISFLNSDVDNYHVTSIQVLEKKHFVDHIILQVEVKVENPAGESVCSIEVKVDQIEPLKA